VRKERKPYLVEANVSRLYGHSSASGANFITEEPDCLSLFEERLAARGILSAADAGKVRKKWVDTLADLARSVRDEPQPDPATIYDHIFKGEG
jgi:2-oxoisovalerate dehydrogenase E1 component alpha subunit